MHAVKFPILDIYMRLTTHGMPIHILHCSDIYLWKFCPIYYFMKYLKFYEHWKCKCESNSTSIAWQRKCPGYMTSLQYGRIASNFTACPIVSEFLYDVCLPPTAQGLKVSSDIFHLHTQKAFTKILFVISGHGACVRSLPQ